MADNKQDGIAVFDTIFTNNHICMLKNVLPFLPTAFQRFIAIYIKYLELQYTMQYFNAHPRGLCTGRNDSEKQPFGIDAMWDSILPYCSPSEKHKFQQMRDMMQNFQQMKEMVKMMETMKELFPDGFSGMDGGGFPIGFGGMEGAGFPDGFGGMEGAGLPAGSGGMEGAGLPAGSGDMEGTVLPAGSGGMEGASISPPPGMEGLFPGNINPEMINMLSLLFNGNAKKGKQQNESKQ